MSDDTVVVADAPGRINLIGEHTDYHGGYVLPTVIPQRTRAELRLRSGRSVRVTSTIDAQGTQTYELGREERGRGWLDYVQGLTFVLARSGWTPHAFDLHITSNVPVGAGVSSSAALEVSVLRALREALHFQMDDVQLAKVAQQAETHFVGVPVGIMDQFAASLGRDGQALFIDTRTLAFEAVPLPQSMRLLAIDSGVTHAHAGGGYLTRRRESFEAAARLGVQSLRDLDETELDRLDALPAVLARRARHVITENARVLAAVAALRSAEVGTLGELCNASHISMRNDYEISTAEIDRLVEIARAHPEVYGARMTGGGFGGTVIAIATTRADRRTAEEIAGKYRAETGRVGVVLEPPEAGTFLGM
ncbi:MAG: galactokinase [Vicinamibacterales bacterium]